MIEFTEAAKNQLAKGVEPNERLRVAVRGGGCAGMSYSLDFADDDDIDEEDVLLEVEHVRIYIDPFTAGILVDTVVDFVKVGLSEGFVFNNPAANTTCGCGMSFS